jgi:phosphatidylserine/phosphatidylglycerophosphate/cardiolipin synthase-like enzyme
MKKTILALAILFCNACSPSSSKEEISLEVNFSPNGGAAEAVVREINLARKSVLVQAYSFTNAQIGAALASAFERGVKVEIILDRENLGNPNSLMFPLHEKGLTIYLDDKHSIAHNKIMIIDYETIITGSMNFTKAGNESNAENSLIIKGSRQSSRYILNWETHQQHSARFNP